MAEIKLLVKSLKVLSFPVQACKVFSAVTIISNVN